MSSVWICIPSVRPGGGTLPAWREKGYRIAIVRQGPSVPEADIEIPTSSYLGWGRSINMAVRAAMEADPEADWFVSGGDDGLPDPDHSPEEIAAQCTEHFGGTFGICQPIGDLKLWPNSRIDTFAGSPWMGRDWCQRAYGGHGPVCEDYYHLFADEELMAVAVKLGVFWQRPDLTHRHEHPLRKPNATSNDWPDFLKPINTSESWERHKALFASRKMRGFPGHEPLELSVGSRA